MEPLISSTFIRSEVCCNFECSWIVLENKNISDVVVYRIDENDELSGLCLSPNSNQTRNGITLKMPEMTDVACTLDVSCKFGANVGITAIDILANARHVEVFSSSGEYQQTSQGIRVDEELELKCDGRKVFMLQNSFDSPLKKCKIKFLTLENSSVDVWLHSIHVTTAAFEGGSSDSDGGQLWSSGGHLLSSGGHLMQGLFGPRIDMKKVEEMMNEMGKEMKPGADQLMRNMMLKHQREREEMKTNLLPLENISSILNHFNKSYQSILTAHHETLHETSPVVDQEDFDVNCCEKSEFSNSVLRKSTSPSILRKSGIDDSDAIVRKEDVVFTSAAAADGKRPEMISAAAAASDGKRREMNKECNPSVTMGILIRNELRLLVAEAEKRLETRLMECIVQTESRLMTKLDEILIRLNGDKLSSCNGQLYSGQTDQLSVGIDQLQNKDIENR